MIAATMLANTTRVLTDLQREQWAVDGYLQIGGALSPTEVEEVAHDSGLVGEAAAEVSRLVLTASGGPFRGMTTDELAAVTPEQALRHPTWDMGAKITIDSATLANKALEVIEAHYLYGLDYDAIDAVVHPQSIIHSLVEFVDYADGMVEAGLPLRRDLARAGPAPRSAMATRTIAVNGAVTYAGRPLAPGDVVHHVDRGLRLELS